MSNISLEHSHLFLVRHGEPNYYTGGLAQSGRFNAKEAGTKLAHNPQILGNVLILSSTTKCDVQTAQVINETFSQMHPENHVALVQDQRLDKLSRYPGNRDELHNALGGLLLEHSSTPQVAETPDTVIVVTDAPMMAVADGRPKYALKPYVYGGDQMVVDHTQDLASLVSVQTSEQQTLSA